MSCAQSHHSPSSEDEDFGFAYQLVTSSMMPLTMHAALQLDLFGIIAKAGPGAHLSAKDVAAQLPSAAPSTPLTLDRVMRLLASFSVLTASLVTDEHGKTERLYGLTPVCKFFVPNEDGISISPLMDLIHDEVFMDSWIHIKDAIVDGGIPFNKAHGMHAFDYPGVDSRFNQVFNKAMFSHSTLFINKFLDIYRGFDDLKVVVDVGGGVGTNIALITSRYPTINGINFDQPHVIEQALARPGVEHVGGDMFKSVPKGDCIFMKWILHDWDDERCLILLKNCYKSLPEDGKMIVVELVVPVVPGSTDVVTKGVHQVDLIMWTQNPGGKERSHEEFEALAKEAGFARLEMVCSVYNLWVMEFHKK